MSPKSLRCHEIHTGLIIPWIPTNWTGDRLQNILRLLCSSFLFLGCLIFVYELLGWPSVPMLSESVRGILSIVKYFYFAGAVFTFTWYVYDVFIYNPYYRRTSERLSTCTSGLCDTCRRNSESSTSGKPEDSEPDWPVPELEPGHPLVEGLRSLRELVIATFYRRPLEQYGDGSIPQRKRRLIGLGEYAESKLE